MSSAFTQNAVHIADAVRPDDPAARTVRELLARAPELDPARIEDALLADEEGPRATGREPPPGSARPVSAGAAAAQVLGCPAEWPEFDPLARRGSGTGAATLCIDVGQRLSLALVPER